MENRHYLTFSLNGLLYGVAALLVQEVFYLPELTPIAEAPKDIVGLLNLRGQILPVMHLALRLGQQMPECSLSDNLIVLAWEETRIGIIVNAVHEVKDIGWEFIESEMSFGRARDASSRFIAGIAKVDADMIMLLDPEKLIRYSHTVETLLLGETIQRREEIIPDLSPLASCPVPLGDDLTEESIQVEQQYSQEGKSNPISSFYDHYCPTTPLEVRAIFRERADSLRQLADSSDFNGLMPIAVIGLNGEYFGLDLGVVREFTTLRNVTPIPCCPQYVVGNMNLRGEIVTLFDIRNVLKMPLTTNTSSKAIVIQINDTVAGVPVDEVLDVMYLRSSDVKNVPVAINSVGNEFLRGTASYSEKMLGILDLQKILTKGDLTVNEEV